MHRTLSTCQSDSDICKYYCFHAFIKVIFWKCFLYLVKSLTLMYVTLIAAHSYTGADSLLEVISLTLVVGLVDSSLISFLLKLSQRGLTPIWQGKLKSALMKVTLRMTFLSRQSSCVVIVPSQLANHAWLRITVPTYWVCTFELFTQLQNQFIP